MQMAERTSQERVRLNAILDRIAAEEKITVTEDDFKQHVMDLSRRYGMSVEKTLKTIRARNAGDNIMAQMRRSKTTGFIMQNVRLLPGAAGGAVTTPQQKDSTEK